MTCDLREQDVEALRRIFRRFPAIHEVRVFGSRATGVSRPRSDLDLAISAPGITPWEWSNLQEALDEAPVIQILDVVRTDQVSDALFLAAIERDGVRIYSA